jgi:hypothetical protein
MIFEKDKPIGKSDAAAAGARSKVHSLTLSRRHSVKTAPDATPELKLPRQAMKTLRRLFVVLTLSLAASACNSTILGPHSPDGGSHSPDGGSHSPDGGSHSPDGGSHSPDGGSHSPDGGSEVTG